MIISTFKGFKLTQKEKVFLLKPLNQSAKILPSLAWDLFKESILLQKKNRHQNNSQKKHLALKKNYLGQVTLILPHRRMHLFFKGATLKQTLKNGKNLVTRQLQKYKELHFKSHSKYPHHQTIRKGEVL